MGRPQKCLSGLGSRGPLEMIPEYLEEALSSRFLFSRQSSIPFTPAPMIPALKGTPQRPPSLKSQGHPEAPTYMRKQERASASGL